MAVDTPARIAVLGAGPIGLEAALYARFLGYDVDIYERGRVGENILRWGHARMVSPFSHNASPLALAALEAHDSGKKLPEANALLTGQEFIEQFLVPLSQTDLLIDSLRLHTEVLAISRGALRKGDAAGSEDREDPPFRLLVRDAEGRERIEQADVVIDATGTYGHPNWAGMGGIPALGELVHAERIEYGLPDVLAAQRDKYAGRHTLVIGCDVWAAATLVALAELIRQEPQTRVTWITPPGAARPPWGPVPLQDDDPLPQRHRLVQQANALAAGEIAVLNHRADTVLESIEWDQTTGQFRAGLRSIAPTGDDGAPEQQLEPLTIDAVVAAVGYRPDRRLWSELHVAESEITGGPLKLAVALQAGMTPDAAALVHPEPDFYVLGAKSYGRNGSFLISAGLTQIRDLFTIIGDRATLDLYANMARMRQT